MLRHRICHSRKLRISTRHQCSGVYAPEWVPSFADWFNAALTQGRTCDLLTYRSLAPYATRNHPTEEHLLPLFVALGAAGADAQAHHIHASQTYGVLRMDAWRFGG